MSENTNIKIVLPVVAISLVFALMGLLFPDYLLYIQYPLLGILVLAIGLPHGATDFLLFRRMNGSTLTKYQIVKFFSIYLFAVGGFLSLWLIFPVISFFIFILISSYHFGQSNWESISLPKYDSYLLNTFWGAFAIGGSVLWHWSESNIIIGQVIGNLPVYTSSTMASIQFGILGINIIFIILLKISNTISENRVWKEIGKLILLSSMLYYTPMLVGFTLYFTLWHSLGSLINQLAFYKKLWPNFTLINYYKQAAPYTIMATIGFTAMVIGHQFILPNASIVSTFLIFIACVTLPHIFLVEESYKY
jgi:Brp/Blh family beta-carotene 15,15'-monooxygenase